MKKPARKTPLSRIIDMLEGESKIILDWIENDTMLADDHDILEASLRMQLAAISLRRYRVRNGYR